MLDDLGSQGSQRSDTGQQVAHLTEPPGDGDRDDHPLFGQPSFPLLPETAS